jgi:predicted phosphate transport protein (TIGR00153 family)
MGPASGGANVAGYFHKIFGESPVLPIQEHCGLCYQAANAMLDMLRHAAEGDWVKAEEGRARVVEFEHRADSLKKEVRSKLPGGMFMPVAREDLLELVIVQDKIANSARDISGLVFGRKMTIPEPIRDSFLAYAKRNVDAAKVASKTIRELDELYEAGFKGKETEVIGKLIDELDEIENETDDLQVNIRQELQALEKQLDPIDVMFLYRVIELLGDIADRAQSVGRRLEILMGR